MKISILLLALCLTLSVASTAPNYTAEKTSEHGVDIVRLTDASGGIEVAIAPSVGNRLYEMKVHGKNVLASAPDDVVDFKKRLETGGIPFLAPWANRLGEEDFWANGKKYTFNMTLGNVRGPVPIHGLLATSPFWEVTEVKADKESAHITSRLQFWKYPDLMAQWPFAQDYEMTYQLSKGMLETRLVVTNLSADPMPIVLGFHPCFRIEGVDRDEWTATIAARKMAVADNRLVATGELTLSPCRIHSPSRDKSSIRASRISNAMPPALRIFPLNLAGRRSKKSSVRSIRLPLFIRRPTGKRCASNQ